MSNTPYYFSNARLIDGTGEPASDRPYALLIDGRHIATVAPMAEFPCPDGALERDLEGRTIMPGLIDCHDHLGIMEGSMRDRAAIPASLAVIKTAEVLKDTLFAGFTSLRDAGGLDYGLKLAVEQGLIQGPRLKISVNILSQCGGHNCHIEPAGVDSHFPILPGVVDCICDGVSECRRRTREMIFAGADQIKLCTTGGVGTRIGGPLIRQFSVEEVQAIVDTAHAADMPVMCHAYGGEGAQIAIDCGVDSIEHGAALDDDLLQQMVRQGTWLVPTFSVLRKILAVHKARPDVLPEYVPRKAKELLEQQVISFQKAISAGVKIALGTDVGAFKHGENATEFEFLVNAGMTPMQAIVAGTQMGAKCMGLGDEVGILRKGMLADLLVVEGDPLTDVRILQDRERLRLIMQDGAIIKDTLIEQHEVAA
jgi:imidazolonepropionase-like amidohydrolase